jgi:acyl-coenzyme A thioesterase PaaI-like protein
MAGLVTVDAATFLAMGREALASQRFSVLPGAELIALEPGRCELGVKITAELKQQMGFAHGGVVSYLHVSKSQAVCECEIFVVSGTQEKLCAIAQGTIARLGEKNGSDS